MKAVHIGSMHIDGEVADKAVKEILRAMAMKKAGLDDLSACESICLLLLQTQVMEKVPT